MIDAAKLLRHLNCEVEINRYNDGCITIECNTCNEIIFSTKCEYPVKPFKPRSNDWDGSNGDDDETVSAVFSDTIPLTMKAKSIEQADIEELEDLDHGNRKLKIM